MTAMKPMSLMIMITISGMNRLMVHVLEDSLTKLAGPVMERMCGGDGTR
jgi:hypothetical protein